MEEFIFNRVNSLVNRVKRIVRPPKDSSHHAQLSLLSPRLTILARAIAGDAIDLLPAEQEGGWSGLTMYLPTSIDFHPSLDLNTSFYIYRTAYLATQRRLNLNWPDSHHRSSQDARDASAKASATVLAELFTEFPQLQASYSLHLEAVRQRAHATGKDAEAQDHWLYGHYMRPLAGASATDAGLDPQRKDAANAAPTTALEAPPKEDVEVLEVDRNTIEDYTLSHSFEKVETAEEFNGNWRDLDGADELDEHSDALNEVDLGHVVRVEDPVHSIMQAQLRLSSQAPESATSQVEGHADYYDEWDVGKGLYKPDYCRVVSSTLGQSRPEYATEVLQRRRGTLDRLRRQLKSLHADFQVLRRQPYGHEPDMDAVVDRVAEMAAGKPPTERVYLADRRRHRDLSLLVLLDVSLSADAFAEGHRVIDIERESAILFGEVLSEADERFQIDAFSSRTRNHCEYTTLKGFDEAWVRGRGRIGAVEPAGYTRIGPAIRHATSIMSKEKARHRWIFVVSDGKPNDYDRYEGQYGIEDVRKAVQEAEGEHVQVFSLAIDSDARFYIPRMFGSQGYRILGHATRLPEALTEFYGKVAAAS